MADEENCSICLEVFKDKVTHAPCGHNFCKSCIKRWYRTSGHKTCPLCRQTEEEEDIYENFDSEGIEIMNFAEEVDNNNNLGDSLRSFIELHIAYWGSVVYDEARQLIASFNNTVANTEEILNP